MAHVAHSHPIAHGFGEVFARVGAGLHRFGERVIEVRLRQAQGVVAERVNWIEHTHAKVGPHDADGLFL